MTTIVMSYSSWKALHWLDICESEQSAWLLSLQAPARILDLTSGLERIKVQFYIQMSVLRCDCSTNLCGPELPVCRGLLELLLELHAWMLVLRPSGPLISP